MLIFGTTLFEKVGSKHPETFRGREKGNKCELDAEIEHVMNTGHVPENAGNYSTE